MAQVPSRISDYAQQQWGLVTRAQALEVLSSSGVYRRVTSGVLITEGPGVYRLAGAPRSWRQRAMAGCLLVGGEVAVSELAAAYLWRARSVAPPRVQLTVPRGRRSGCFDPRPHRLPLPPSDVTARWGIPTTTPARTIIDLSCRVGRPLLERIVDDLVRDQHLRVDELVQRMTRADPLPRYDRSLVEQIVELRLTRGIGASPREDWIADTLLAAGVEMPVRNVIVEAGGRLYEIDLAYPQLKIGIEYDGLGSHGDDPHFHSDREKVTLLQLDGWLILQVTAKWTADVLVERVITALDQRRRQPSMAW